MSVAGSKIVDPTFGATILRLTDATSYPSGAGSLYSTYPSVNLDSTRILGRNNANSNAIFWPFNKNTFTVGTKFDYNGNPNVLTYYMVWSGLDPNKIWATGHPSNGSTAACLYSFVVTDTTTTATLIKDFGPTGANLTAAGLAPGTYYLDQMSMSKNDDIFSFSVRTLAGGTNGYLVYKRSTNTVLINQAGDINETYIDKSGRYFTWTANNPANQVIVWDLQANGGPAPIWTTSYAHNGIEMGGTFTDGGASCLTVRHFATQAMTSMMCPYFNFSNNQSHHESGNATDESYALISRFNQAGGGVTQPFDNELLQVSLTSNAVRRIAHHRSISNQYIAMPFANISPDGQFVAFTSTWGTNLSSGGRIDLYLVKIPTAEGTPPAPPTGLVAR